MNHIIFLISLQPKHENDKKKVINDHHYIINEPPSTHWTALIRLTTPYCYPSPGLPGGLTVAKSWTAIECYGPVSGAWRRQEKGRRTRLKCGDGIQRSTKRMQNRHKSNRSHRGLKGWSQTVTLHVTPLCLEFSLDFNSPDMIRICVVIDGSFSLSEHLKSLKANSTKCSNLFYLWSWYNELHHTSLKFVIPSI